MKSVFLIIVSFFSFSLVNAQNFRGQWKGSFSDGSNPSINWAGNDCDYVLDIETNGVHVSGYSYTYFTAGGEKYYTICEIAGTIKKQSHYIEVRETKRIKTNVPFNIRNCLQIHKLTYFKKGENETLDGNWIPVPNSEGDCGFGLTKLSRRTLSASYPGYKKSVTVQSAPRKSPPVSKIKPKQAPVKKAPPVTKTNPKVNPETVLKRPEIKKELSIDSNPSAIKPMLNNSIDYRKRSRNLMKTITVSNRTIKIDLYDNGEIDGDSISLFFNDRLVLSNQRLSDKAVSLTLNLNDNPEVNELIMYAENLGTIPPNTALMVVTDGKMRYEVRIDSDLKKSGVIHFILKE